MPCVLQLNILCTIPPFRAFQGGAADSVSRRRRVDPGAPGIDEAPSIRPILESTLEIRRRIADKSGLERLRGWNLLLGVVLYVSLSVCWPAVF
jgi:hypothetical protein